MNTSSERSGPQWPKWWLIILPLLLLPVLLAAGLLAQVASATMTDVVRASGANSVLEPNETPSPTPTVCGATWQVVSSPNIASYSNQLNDVAEISANDVWAVGYYYYGQTYKTLIEHWDGSVWSIVPSPNVPGYYNTLQSVSAISPNDIWAVGGHGPGSGSGHTLTEHWDGTQWSIVPSPNPDPYETILNSVVALSPNDVWAVGSTTPAFAWQTLIIHWDGTQWAVVTSPNPGPSDNSLNDITAISANDIWAVGDYYTGSDDRHHALTIHWNGIQWNTVASPDTGTEHFLRSITALATNDVWAVGYYGGNFATNTLTQHWDGTQWTIISSPNPGVQNVLYAVDALSSNDIWAVGDYFNGTIAVHWDGISWALVPSPNPGSSYNHLYGVAAGTIDEEWAVGDYLTGGVLGTLIERYNDPCTPPPTYTPTPTVCKLQWQLVSSPNIGSLGGDLNGVAAISANDIWAVGYYWNDGSSRTLIEHWDGSQWSIVPSPNVGTGYSYLSGVAAISANDIWAVGRYWSNGPYRTLIAHWDGSQWSIVLGPNAGPKYGSELNGVAAISANDIWAVGYYWNDGPYRTLIEHWDGSQWSIVPSPNSSTGDNVLYEVASVSATHLWAVGYYNNQNQGEIDTLVEHWDGTQWSIVPSPNFSDLGSGLTGVAAISANDVWAVGNYINTGLSRAQTLIEHWDGSQWSIVPSPNTGSPYANYLNGMAAISANDVWAAGYYGDAATLVEHWDGSQWSIVPSPNAGPAFKSYLNGMAAISANDVWAVGRADAAVQQTLVERYNNPCGAPTPTNTPTSTVTGTPPTTTSTLTRTNTPNAAPTLCPITFTDVHTTDYFYVPVQYLFCRGVIAGYGTEFRPYNNTSRGQLAKIVVLGFSLPINTTGGPHFVDVPTSNVFYPYVETAFNRGIVNGYGTEYRPNDNVTRGQLSKIVVLTAGWQLRTPTTATFTDVPLGGTFFSYVETAVCHGIVSGYGTLFKPNDPATRGQISKIVYLALTSTTVCP